MNPGSNLPAFVTGERTAWRNSQAIYRNASKLLAPLDKLRICQTNTASPPCAGITAQHVRTAALRLSKIHIACRTPMHLHVASKSESNPLKHKIQLSTERIPATRPKGTPQTSPPAATPSFFSSPPGCTFYVFLASSQSEKPEPTLSQRNIRVVGALFQLTHRISAGSPHAMILIYVRNSFVSRVHSRRTHN